MADRLNFDLKSRTSELDRYGPYLNLPRFGNWVQFTGNGTTLVSKAKARHGMVFIQALGYDYSCDTQYRRGRLHKCTLLT